MPALRKKELLIRPVSSVTLQAALEFASSWVNSSYTSADNTAKDNFMVDVFDPRTTPPTLVRVFDDASKEVYSMDTLIFTISGGSDVDTNSASATLSDEDIAELRSSIITASKEYVDTLKDNLSLTDAELLDKLVDNTETIHALQNSQKELNDAITEAKQVQDTLTGSLSDLSSLKPIQDTIAKKQSEILALANQLEGKLKESDDSIAANKQVIAQFQSDILTFSESLESLAALSTQIPDLSSKMAQALHTQAELQKVTDANSLSIQDTVNNINGLSSDINTVNSEVDIIKEGGSDLTPTITAIVKSELDKTSNETLSSTDVSQMITEALIEYTEGASTLNNSSDSELDSLKSKLEELALAVESLSSNSNSAFDPTDPASVV